VALEAAEDGIEAAHLNLYRFTGSPGFESSPNGYKDLEVHIERRRISSADPFNSSFAAPEFHAAFEVRVEDPHVILSPKALNGASFLPRLCCYKRRG
jgi:hypothetical protein